MGNSVRCALCGDPIKPGDQTMLTRVPDKGAVRVHFLCHAKAGITRAGRQVEPETSFFRKEPYKRHAIIISTSRSRHVGSRHVEGWTAEVTIHDAGDAVVMGPMELGRDVPFTTPELADKAALRFGREWIHRFC